MKRVYVWLVFATIISLLIGIQIGKFDTCEKIYRSGNMPSVTYRNGVLLWHPWQVIDSSDADSLR
jgi:hypothetical protein